MNKKREIILAVIGYAGALAGCFGVIMLNRYVMMSLPLIGRMILMLVSYWLIALVPVVIMLLTKEKDPVLRFSVEKIGMQIASGVIAGLILASAYFWVPYLLGFGSLVDNGDRFTKAWQFAYELFYFIIAVGAVEEIVFRGFLYSKLKNIFQNEWAAIILSSVLFGLFHILIGNIVQVCITAIIGFIFCLVRYKIKNFSMLSLILMHGVYDFLLALYSSLLFK
jgi:membrane protease YdiL (CAAX protease family)